MEANAYNYLSDERLKNNIKEYKFNAIKLIENSKIYKYNFKENGKEEFGLVIGEGYNTPKEIIEKNNEFYSINSYRMNCVLWKAIQEQQEEIRTLQKEIKSLKGDNYGQN